MGNKIIYIASVVFLIGIIACEEKWEEHYQTEPVTVDKNIWDAVKEDQNLSNFVQYMEDMNYDTLFETNNPYTLFIPENEAFTQLSDTVTVDEGIMSYLISLHHIQSGNIHGKRKIETLSEKFALFENSSSGLMLLDGIELKFESPLYRNGKFFTLTQVATPRPNIYEYYAVNNPIFKDFVDSQDSIILDREESRPIGFDEEGNTIYDTVAIIYNEFEEEFFPVREEFRNKTATVVFPKVEDYNTALTNMANELGDVYQDYRDIPLKWQNDILIPYILERGVFENMLEKEVFLTPTYGDTIKMKNVLGDSVIIDYEPDDKVICSNGYVYNYLNFEVADTLYKGSTVFEGEWLTRETGINRFSYRDEVNVIGDVSVPPSRDFNDDASNDSIFRVFFPSNFEGHYSVEFPVENLFPRKYLMVVRTHMNVGGIYEIYVNDELVKTFDYYDYVLARGGLIWSVTGDKRYIPEGAYNKFDCFVDNQADYGKAKIKFVYTGPGEVLGRGLVIDYIEFIPYEF
jgi:hypothetical protein